MNTNVVVVQAGSRNKYLVAALCQKHGILKQLHTDIWLSRRWHGFISRLSFCGKALKRYTSRWSDDIPDDKVVSYDLIGFKSIANRILSKNISRRTLDDLGYKREFMTSVARRLQDFHGIVYALSEADGLFDKIPNAYKILELVNCDALYKQYMMEELQSWPGWEDIVGYDFWDKVVEREKKSYINADLIVCPSKWVEQYLLSTGINGEKVKVVPYWCPPVAISEPKNYDGKRKLRVLFLGRVTLIKGIQYLVESFKLMKDDIDLTVIGESFLRRDITACLKSQFRMLSHIPYGEVSKYYKWADVFVLPTLCEGSALVVYEALSYGVPVITTPNCGSILENGYDGFIIQPRDSSAISDSLNKFIKNPALVEEFSENAINEANANGIEKYGSALMMVFSSITRS